MDKLNRNYLLQIEKAVELDLSKKFIELAPPFTVEFDIQQNNLAAVRQSTFRIRNLSADNRGQIRQDQYGFGVDVAGSYRKVLFAGGYGQNIPLLFFGNLQQAWSAREGVDFITTCTAFGSGAAAVQAKVDISFGSGTPAKSIIESVIKTMEPYGVKQGLIGRRFDGLNLKRGNSYSGNAFDILNSITGGGFFTYNGKVYVLGDNECYPGPITRISASEGLIGTPLREKTYLYFDMIFEPRLAVGQKITLESKTGDGMNGDWKIVSLRHRGMISPTVCGTAITSVGLTSGTSALELVGG